MDDTKGTSATKMSILSKVNAFFFKSQYSIFDILWLSVMFKMIEQNGYWWFLLIIPFTVASAVMNAFVMVKDEQN